MVTTFKSVHVVQVVKIVKSLETVKDFGIRNQKFRLLTSDVCSLTSGLHFGGSTSRGLIPSVSLTRPWRSIISIIRAARLYPTLNLL